MHKELRAVLLHEDHERLVLGSQYRVQRRDVRINVDGEPVGDAHRQSRRPDQLFSGLEQDEALRAVRFELAEEELELLEVEVEDLMSGARLALDIVATRFELQMLQGVIRGEQRLGRA